MTLKPSHSKTVVGAITAIIATVSATLLAWVPSFVLPLRLLMIKAAFSAVNILTGGATWADMPFHINFYAVALVTLCVTALAAGMVWMALPAHRGLASLVGIGASFVPMAVGFLFGDRYAAVGAVVGSVLCIGGLWLYGWLQKVCPTVFNRETVRYIVFGVLTTVVSFVSQMLFAALGTPAAVNTVGSWVCAVIFAYIVNKLFVFESHTDSAKAFMRELWLFVAARLASLGMELVFMVITVDLLHFSEAICKLIAQVFILVANYIFSKWFIFKKKDT